MSWDGLFGCFEGTGLRGGVDGAGAGAGTVLLAGWGRGFEVDGRGASAMGGGGACGRLWRRLSSSGEPQQREAQKLCLRGGGRDSGR